MTFIKQQFHAKINSFITIESMKMTFFTNYVLPGF